MTDQSRVPSLSPPPTDHLEAYVLGLLDEAERDALETRAFGDPEVAAAIDEAETDLVDGYLDGTLTGPTREAFGVALSRHPRLRARVEAASALRDHVAAAAARRRWSLLTGLAIAASLIVTTALWFAVDTPPPVATDTQTTRAADPQPTPAPAPPVEREPEKAGTPALAPRPPARRSVFAVTLPPGTTRDATVTTARVADNATHVEFRIPILAGDDFPSYRVAVTGRGGQSIVDQQRTMSSGRMVAVTVSRDALDEGLHDVSVDGLASGRSPEPLVRLQVRIVAAP